MYNLTVDQAHTFYVGDQEWLVHNASCPSRSPNGKSGGPLHQQALKKLLDYFKQNNIPYKTEYKVLTPGGYKPFRFIDVAELGANGKPVAFYQVGDITSTGVPIAREVRAINDVMLFGNIKAPIFYMPK